MIGIRGVLVMFIVASVITILVMGYSDKLAPTRTALCNSVNTGQIDQCAQSGGSRH